MPGNRENTTTHAKKIKNLTKWHTNQQVLHLYDKQGIGKNLNDPVKKKVKKWDATLLS
jgi:hypothetical protein